MNESSLSWIILSITLIILLLATGIIMTIVLTAKKRLQEKMVFNERRLELEQELRVVQVEATEEALNKMARELHDDVSHMLTYTGIQIETLKLDRPEIVGELNPILETVKESREKIRSLSHAMNADVIMSQGLMESFHREVVRLRGLKQYTVAWHEEGEQMVLTTDQQVMVFRMFQEMLNNTLKYAEASKIWISVEAGTIFKLTFKDGGKGFDPISILSQGKTSGILNMQKRARLAGLSMSIEAAPDKGCTYVVTSQPS